MHKILVTGAGSGGGENLIGSLRRADLDLFIVGSNMDEFLLAKSTADKTVWLPSGLSEGYTPALDAFIRREGIELVIPNNDTEVGRISRDRDKLSCTVFLPPDETVCVCQDKLRMHEVLAAAGIPQALFRNVNDFGDIDAFMAEHPADKYWVRTRRGSGSVGATWVQNAEQARAWIDLWIKLRGYSITDFLVSEFLPGKDYAFQSVWKDGELVVAKMIERVSYLMGRMRLSGMSSTPAVARTVRDEQALATIMRAIRTISPHPHGNFNLDLKGGADGPMRITEFNIGRFCAITPVFDSTGKYNTAEMHVRAALGLPIEVDEPIDIEEGRMMIRELDSKPLFIGVDEFNALVAECKRETAL